MRQRARIVSLCKGFTLIELLLVMGIIGVIASVIIVAINPSKQIADTEDAKRRSDVKAILDAVHQYNIDKGYLPRLPNGSSAIPTTEKEICAKSNVSYIVCVGPNNGIYLDGLVTDGYLLNLPIDPNGADPARTWGTNYFVIKDSVTSRITVRAPVGNNGAGISITR